ncbi:MAG: hypothetical protein K2Y16_04975 [Burkholderiales bacterium]|nr:hypothetical protein [Burkholderiales bacterium]
MPEKQYGKLTADQFRRLIRKLPEFRSESKAFHEELRAASPEKLREVLGDGIWWAPLYEMPFAEVVALMVCAIGQADYLKEAVQSPDPQEIVLAEWEKLADSADMEHVPKDVTKADLIAIASALQRNVLSIMLYKRSLCSLVAEAKEGNDSALFEAVRVDQSAVTCPTLAVRITRAVLLGEKQFFIRLRSALKGPSRKHWEGYQDLRYSLAILREMGFDQLSDAELEHLLVDVLKVYPKTYTARKNLRKQYTESKKIKGL